MGYLPCRNVGTTGADGKEIVANLFLPIVHQIMDNSNYLLDEELEDENAGRITTNALPQ